MRFPMRPTAAFFVGLVAASCSACGAPERPRPVRPDAMLSIRRPAARAVQHDMLPFRHYFAVTGVTPAADFFYVTFHDGEPVASVYAAPVTVYADGPASRKPASVRLVRERWGHPMLIRDAFEPRFLPVVEAIRTQVRRHHGEVHGLRVRHMGFFRELHVREWMPIDPPDEGKRLARWMHATLAIHLASDASPPRPRLIAWESGLTLLCGTSGKECDRARFFAFDAAVSHGTLQLLKLLPGPDGSEPRDGGFTARVLKETRALLDDEPPAPSPAARDASLLPDDLAMQLELLLQVGEGYDPLETRIELPWNRALLSGGRWEHDVVLGGVPLHVRVTLGPECRLPDGFSGEHAERLRLQVELRDDRGRRSTRAFWLEGSFLVEDGRVGVRTLRARNQPKPLPVAPQAEVLLDRIQVRLRQAPAEGQEHGAGRVHPSSGMLRP